MEVRDEGVDHVEGAAGHEVELGGGVLADHDVTPAEGVGAVGPSLEAPRHDGGACDGRLGIEGALERAHGRGAHGDDAVAGGLGGVHGVNDVLAHVVALGVHHVLGRVVLLHQAEGVDAHLELDGGPAHAPLAELLDELGREVQAGRGRRGGVLLLHGVDGLVLLGVALVARDVGRQGDVAGGMDGGVERERLAGGVAALRLEAHEAPALGVLHEVDDLAGEHHRRAVRGVQAARAVLDDGAGLEALAGVHEALPDVAHGVDVLAALEQQGLGHAAGLGLLAHEARRHDARLVGNQQVTRLEVIHDVVEVAVLDRGAVGDRLGLAAYALAATSVQHEQPAGVSWLGRGLGDELFWQRVVEVVGAHVFSPFAALSAKQCSAPTAPAKSLGAFGFLYSHLHERDACHAA